MLSPGNYHLKVPKDRDENLRYRRDLLNWAHLPERQARVMRMCSRDIVAWINLFVFQYNPKSIGRASEKVGPFITWGFQDEALLRQPSADHGPGILWCIENQEDMVIDKSRDMGASWLCLLVITWFLLFRPNEKILVISRNEDAVDRPDDSDALFWKIDYMLRRMPDWMTEGVVRRKLGYTNTKIETMVNGQATTSRAGIGGRATLIFADEFSRIAKAYEVFSGTSDTSACRIFNGTQHVEGPCFAELTDPDSALGSYINKLQMHWTLHPDKRLGLYRWDAEKNQVSVIDKDYEFPPDFEFVQAFLPTGGFAPGVRSPWYDDQCRRKPNPRAIAMDLDMDRQGSVSQFFNSQMIHSRILEWCRPPMWEGELSFDSDTAEPLDLMKREGGRLKLWMTLTPEGKPPPARYAAGADIAFGQGATLSCFTIINAERGEKVLEYANAMVRPEEFAALCVALCKLFADKYGTGAAFAWENAGPAGKTFGGRVVGEFGYQNIYMRDDEFILKPQQSKKAGWYPTPEAKLKLLGDYDAALWRRDIVNRSEAALKECLKFKLTDKTVEHTEEESKNDPAGARMNHGDRVIADALAWKMAAGMAKPILEEKKQEVPHQSLEWRRRQRHNARREADVWL